MTRKDFVKKLIAENRSDEEIVAAVMKGDTELEVKPMTGKDEKEKKTFSALIVKRIKKEIAE